jgi:hypothetical protein
MAPDAGKTRVQLRQPGDDVGARGLNIDGLNGDEVAIDGLVYSLNDFVHPGGEQIKLFGGNDVTVQYKVSRSIYFWCWRELSISATHHAA